MKRSEINQAVKKAFAAFEKHGWILPPNPKWDVTDFGLGDFKRYGLTSVNLAEQPEYCEKIMFVNNKQVVPTHYHASKKEDIICRWGRLAIKLEGDKDTIRLQVNGEEADIPTDKPFVLSSGERITLVRGVRHAFWAESEYAIVGEVSTANDDENDNFFDNPNVKRFMEIEEDEPALVKLVSE